MLEFNAELVSHCPPPADPSRKSFFYPSRGEFFALQVDQVLVSINHAIANQANWKVLEQVLQEQKELGDNPVANCIVRLQLESNQAVLRLRLANYWGVYF